ncbi:sulfur carrier protein ThiS [Pseudalkalibacillus hwajinpoensis]|uniref:sulfur carrier protein ThiS n=1 Tax=Guptibacillus hwajinpoensis TaxID=208199 RepID=UPI00325A6136
MTLFINGEPYELNVTNLQEVIAHFELQEGLVVTEVEGNIVDRSQWLETKVSDGMKIELVHFVGGG